MKHLLLVLFLLAGVLRAIAQPCNLNLSTQSQVNAVPATGCTTVSNLVITGGSSTNPGPDPIVNLTPLAGITAVTGSVALVLNDLTNLQALDNIQTIGGGLSITGATSATNLFINSFQSLQSIGGDLLISGNPGITAISGFPLLRTTKSVNISNNAALGNVSGFGSLQSTGTFLITQCAALRSIGGFDNLASIVPRLGQTQANFFISDNSALQTITAFVSLNTLDNFSISNNAALQQLTGFNNLRNAQSVYIANNASLTTISGFNGGLLATIGGNFNINTNPLLQAITGFNGIQGVQNLSISGNAGLPDIAGFNNGAFTTVNVSSNATLTAVSGFQTSDFTATVQLLSNAQLATISGFTGPRAPSTIYLTGNPQLRNFAQAFAFGSYTSLTSLNITGNTLLAACAQPWICSYLRRGGGVTISNNAASCTQPAILQACQPLAVQAPVAPVPAYPNPVADVLHLSSPSAYTVRDLLGRVLRQGQGAQIPMTDLPAGVYIVESGNERKTSMRISKQ